MFDLFKIGICYIELCNLDLNFFLCLGIVEDIVDFLYYFMLYLLWIDEKEEVDEWVKIGDIFNE